MSLLRNLIAGLRALVRKTQAEQEMNEELRDYLDAAIQAKVRSGMTPEQARRAAKVEMGSMESVKEQIRSSGWEASIESLAQDLRYGLRQLRRSPGFTAVAVLTLALGIGANTAIFSVINAAMLRMLPVQSPEQLVQIGFSGKHSGQSFVGESFSYPLFKELRERNQVFTDISAFDYWDSFDAYPASPASTSEPVKGQLVSANFFSLLGVKPVVGRAFAADEDSGAGAHPVAVISYALWTRMFARDPAVLGKKLRIGGTPFTIIGVAPPHFSGVNPGRTCELWAPVTVQPLVAPSEFDMLTSADTHWLTLMARLKPGVSIERARAGLDLVYQQTHRQYDVSKWSEQDRQDFFTQHIVLLPAARGTDYLRKEFRQPLFLLMGMVGLVLLIACANVANLLLARASARHNEITVRLALGAGRRRLIRQLLTESVLLALMGGALGVLFAYWGSPLLVVLMSHGQYGMALSVYPDARVLAFAIGVALVTGMAFGLAPALRATRTTVRPAPRHLTATRRGRRLGGTLVVAQVALSLVMVVGAGLLVRTFHNLETLDPGFSRRNVLLFWLDPLKAGYKDLRAVQLQQEVLDHVQQVPGVRSASFSFLTPISGGGWDNAARWVEGYTPYPGENMDVYINAVGQRYFKTLGTPLLLGRDFSLQDQSGSTLLALINQTMARRFFGNRSPLGRHFGLGPWSGKRGIEIIGVVGDTKYLSLRQKVPPTAYLYIPQLPSEAVPAGVTFEISSSVPPMSLVPQIRSLVAGIDSRLVPTDVKTLGEQVDQSLYQERMMSALSSFFGVLALMLACIGLYGVMSYAVARRTNEIGIRMALGAERRDILKMILRETLAMVGMGVAVGVPAALAATRLITSLLYGLKSSDPFTLAASVLVMAAAAALAGYVPARRASWVDPMVALRYE